MDRMSIWLKVPGSQVSVLEMGQIKEQGSIFEVRARHMPGMPVSKIYLSRFLPLIQVGRLLFTVPIEMGCLPQY